MKTDNPARASVVLHVGNILNNGYLHCKYLRKRGVPADVLNVDYRHCQGQPEWAEAPITVPVDEWNPSWDKVDLHGFRRPDWFFDVAAVQLPYLSQALAEGGHFDARPWGAAAAPKAPVLSNVNAKLQKAYVAARHAVGTGLAALGLKELALSALIEPWRRATGGKLDFGESKDSRNDRSAIEGREIAERLCRQYGRDFPDAARKLSFSDILEFLPHALLLQFMLRRYRLNQCYALDPIYSIIAAPDQPLICYEHGTMRDFPFEDSARGRLYSLALKRADKVMITNADCKGSADRLGLRNAIFIPHIIDDDLFRPAETALRERLTRQWGCDHILVAPARHHWKNAPPGLENSWFKGNDVLIRGLARLFAERPALKVLVVFFDWGQEANLSRDLIRECGFADRVAWVPLQSKPVLKDYYNAADVVLDQFNAGIGTFGAVLPESMACAKPVILNFKEDIHRWCYPELPPAVINRRR